MDHSTRQDGVGMKRVNSNSLMDGCICRMNNSSCDCSKRMCPDLSISNPDGQTSLHLLCQNRTCSLEEVMQTTASFPSALRQRDVYGRTPLFYALKRACHIDVVTYLFDQSPEAVLYQDFCGDIPLYLLYHSSKDCRILKHVLQLMPSLSSYKEKTFSSQPLINRLWHPWAHRPSTLTSEELQNNRILKDRWMKLVLTTEAAFLDLKGKSKTKSNHQQKKEVKELHAALECKFPAKVLRHFASVYAEQASLPIDFRGGQTLPLHYYLIHLPTCTNDARFAIRSLLKAFPAAVVRDFHGQLPIHLAITAGLKWEYGIQDITYAHPDHLDCAEPVHGLIPFMLAASVDEPDLSTAYSLLLENPTCLLSH